MADLLPGTQLGPFVLENRLGTGGMATVFRALDTRLERRVALKFLHEEISPSSQVGRRLLREAQAAARLKHPNLVEIYGAEEIDGRIFLVMEYVEGTALDRVRPDRRAGVTLVRKVAEAIDHAHALGVIHRDLKPANIILDRAGEPHVVDFGLAHVEDSQARLTRTGSQLGTPYYMAPEQVAGRPDMIDGRTDVYGLGSILYELLADRPVFPSSSLAEIYSKIQNEDPAPPSRWRRDVPPDLDTVCLKALAKEPHRRYARASDLAEDLRRWLEGEPIQARRTSVAYWIRKKFAKHRWAALAAGAIVLLLAAFALYLSGARGERLKQKAAWVEEGAQAERERLWEKALGAYERAHALDPADAGLRQKRDLMASRVREERDRLKFERDRAEALKAATEVYEGARRDLHALRLRSYNADWRLTGAEFDAFRGLADRCRAQMDKTGESGNAWWVIGRAAQVLGKWREALAAYDAGLRAEPAHAACRLAKARILIERSVIDHFSGRLEGYDEKMKEGVALLEGIAPAGEADPIELDMARGYAKVILQGEPLGEYCAKMLEKWRGADFREEFYVIRALAQPRNFADDMREALRLRPAFYEAYFWRGGLRRTRGEVRQAIEDLTKSLEINPRFADALLNRGLALTDAGRFKEAVDDHTAALEIDPNLVEAYANRGIARRAGGDLEGAIADHTKAIELDPRFAGAYANRAAARYAMGDRDGAIADLAKAVEVAPPNWPHRAQVEETLKNLRAGK